MAGPTAFSLDPALAKELTFEERTLWNIAYTTGTTSGLPSPFFNTTHDQYHIMMQARACNEAEGGWAGRSDREPVSALADADRGVSVYNALGRDSGRPDCERPDGEPAPGLSGALQPR